MKISQWVHPPEMEVIVDISGEDAIEAICDESMAEAPHLLKMACNNIAAFLKNVPDEMIAQLEESSRSLIADFLRKQAERFKPSGRESGE